MRAREVFPGALIATLLTASALLALLVGLGMRGNGPLALGLGGSDGSAQLSDGEGQDVAAPVSGRSAPAVRFPSVLASGGVAASGARSATRRRTTAALQGAA